MPGRDATELSLASHPPASAEYRPVLELASGGMGVVSVCVRKSGTFERLYAVKRLHPHLRHDEATRSMFLDEARLAGLIRHANVVSALDVGADAEGPYLVMDYVEGVSLSRFIKEHANTGERPPAAICAAIASQIARGLHAAHDLVGADGQPLHLVHRDVSPQNVLLGQDGVVRVTDFGVAKALGRSTHTSTGLLKGKVGYMSPEHLRFEPLDRRTDLFALGVVLVELLTTRRLYAGPDAATAARGILHDPPPDLGDERPDVPPALVELAFHLLAKDPRQRPATAAEVADRLDDVVAEGGPVDLAGYIEARFGHELLAQRAHIRRLASEIAQRPTTTPVAVSVAPVASAPRHRPFVPFVLGAAVLVGLAVGGWWWQRAGDMESTATSAPATSEASVRVRVDSRPTGATLKIDERLQGVTPLELVLPGTEDAVTLELALPGYVTTTHELVPADGEKLVVALTPKPVLIPSVAIESAPSGGPPPEDADADPPARKSKRRGGRRGRRSKAAAEPDTPQTDKPRFRRFD